MLRFSRWTLRSKLIALMVVLVGGTSVVIGGVMSLVVKQSFSQQFDTSIQSAAQRLAHSSNDSGMSDSDGPFVESGTIVAGYVQASSEASGYLYTGTSSHTALTTDELESIAAVSPGAPHSIVVGSHGEYRVATVNAFSPTLGPVTVAVGQPTADLNTRVAGVLLPIAVVVLLVIVLAALIGAVLFRRALRPLRRVAAVAASVADLPLDRGDVDLAQRVPESETDPHTEVGQVGAALNALLDSVASALAVRQASEEKVRTFVADASHELRTPLASIRGYAELTRRFGGDLGEQVEHNIGRIESEAQRMTSLVEDLLLLARLDAERELDRGEVDLSRLLLDVLSDAHAAGPDHEWEIDLPPEPVVVYGDDEKLHQVFTNLLANARVHTPAGTRVALELQQPDDESAVVVVRDEGPGIPDDLQPKLFERFARGDSSRNRGTGSTGLGLSIVQAVVAAHHGSVEVESRPGETVFTIRLPLHQGAKQPALA